VWNNADNSAAAGLNREQVMQILKLNGCQWLKMTYVETLHKTAVLFSSTKTKTKTSVNENKLIFVMLAKTITKNR